MESQEKEKAERSTRKTVQKDLNYERCQLTLNDLFNKTDLRPLITDHLRSSASSHGI